jgi:Flp pilus assembly pilin Flp
MNRLAQLWREDDGVLSFEWTLLLTLLTIGIVGGLAAARDAIIDELGDVAEAAQGIDQSFSLAGLSIPDVFETPSSSFEEDPLVDALFTDCARTDFNPGQVGLLPDTDS